jgi:hypothetical protein
MPTPGPRNQFRPLPGYRNPEHTVPNFFNLWKRPGPVWWPGRSPATMALTLRGMILAAGQIRRLWHQSINYYPAQDGYSWTANGTDSQHGVSDMAHGFQITRALRYKTSNAYLGAMDNSRYANLHTTVKKSNRAKPVTVNAGQKRNMPTVRNRLTSFGSRVTPLNPGGGV